MAIAKYAALVLLSALGAGSALAEPADTVKAAGEEANWLFIQTASGADFDGTTLTLKDVNPSVVMFTDRPMRLAEAIPTDAFLAHWNADGSGSFQSDPPNAGLTSIVDGKLQTASVELMQPVLDGTTLTYQVRVLEGTLPQTAGATSVFIDDNPWDPRG